MKAIILASLAIVAVFAAAIMLFRARAVDQRVRALVAIYAVGAVVLEFVYLGTPKDLGFLPPGLLARPPWFDLASALFFYSAAFFGGILQLYNLADRGLSLRLLIDVLEARGGTATASYLFCEYGGGRGISAMYQKRIADMAANHLVALSGDVLSLTARGRATAYIYERLRRFLHVGD